MDGEPDWGCVLCLLDDVGQLERREGESDAPLLPSRAHERS